MTTIFVYPEGAAEALESLIRDDSVSVMIVGCSDNHYGVVRFRKGNGVCFLEVTIRGERAYWTTITSDRAEDELHRAYARYFGINLRGGVAA